MNGWLLLAPAHVRLSTGRTGRRSRSRRQPSRRGRPRTAAGSPCPTAAGVVLAWAGTASACGARDHRGVAMAAHGRRRRRRRGGLGAAARAGIWPRSSTAPVGLLPTERGVAGRASTELQGFGHGSSRSSRELDFFRGTGESERSGRGCECCAREGSGCCLIDGGDEPCAATCPCIGSSKKGQEDKEGGDRIESWIERSSWTNNDL